jgi:glycosyltransferase involved in cell wall biosynthesis
MLRKYSQWADGFGVLSSDEYINFVNAGFSPNKVFIIKNIVNPSVYIKNSIFHNKYSTNNCAILLFVARLIPQKGLLETIKAAIILKGKSYDFKLIVLGDGPDKIIAEKMVDVANISSSVFFAGFLPEEQTKEFYANSDVLVFPTYHEEGFPMAVFQSVAAGLPIITTKTRASADYLKEPDNCLWVQPKNPEMLAEKIAYLLDNPNVSFQMSENNKKLSNLFTQEVVCKELELDFETILKE